MSEHLTEHVTDWRNAITVEQATRTIRNVALAGPESKNGYRYAPAALKAAVPLYENTPVFLDHPTSVQRPRERSARDLAGSVTNVRFEAGRLRGDLRTLDTDAGRTLLALAAADGPGVGMSHVVLAERSADGTTVERIVEVISVDAVAFPATTSTFRESVCGVGEDACTRPAGATRCAFDVVLASASGQRPECMRDACTTTGEDSVPPSREREESGARVERVRQLMKLSPEGRAKALIPTERDRSAERSAPTSRSVLSAPAFVPPRPGSLERLLASVDARLPGHLRRLAAASGFPGRGRGVRVGVFPSHIVVEWRSVGRPPEHFALAWSCAGDGVAFGDELIPFDAIAERLGSWFDACSPFRKETYRKETYDDTPKRLERLAEQLRTVTAERDRLAERLTGRGPTSVLRHLSDRSAIADDQFVRTIRRR